MRSTTSRTRATRSAAATTSSRCSTRRRRSRARSTTSTSCASARRRAAPRELRQSVRVLALVVLAVPAGVLDRLPPRAVLAVPRDGAGEPLGQRNLRLPAELGPDLPRVERVAAIVAGAILHAAH